MNHILHTSKAALDVISLCSLYINQMVSAVCHFPTVQAAVDTSVQILQSGLPVARMGKNIGS